MNQSVSGVGLANSYRYLSAEPHVFHSHSSGSGAYSYESAVTVQKDVESKSSNNLEDYFSSDRKIEAHESVSASSVATTLNIPGSFKVAPIKSLWRDAARSGNIEGVALIAIFDESRSLNKEMVIKTSGTSYADLTQLDISGNYEASIDLNAAFNGTARYGMIMADPKDLKGHPVVAGQGPDGQRHSKTMIDEFYRCSFSLEKKMKISIKITSTVKDDDWLPCCFGGYITEPAYYQKGSKGFGADLTNIFDCTCFKPTPASAATNDDNWNSYQG